MRSMAVPLSAVVLFFCAAAFVSADIKQAAVNEKHAAVIRARLDTLQSIWADYEVVTDYVPADPTPPKRQGARVEIQRDDPVTESRRFERLGNLARYENRTVDFANENDRRYLHHAEVRVYGGDRYEQLRSRGPDLGSKIGKIQADEPLPGSQLDTIDVALGMRPSESGEWLTAEGVGPADLAEVDGRVILAQKGQRGRLHRWTFNPEEGYRLESYELVHEPTSWVMVRTVAGEFVEQDGLILPSRIREYKYGKDGAGQPVSRRTRDLEVKRYVISPPDNTADRYRIEWPDGTRVLDARIGLTFESHDGELRPLQQLEPLEEELLSTSDVHRMSPKAQDQESGPRVGEIARQAETSVLSTSSPSPDKNRAKDGKVWLAVGGAVIVFGMVAGLLAFNRRRSNPRAGAGLVVFLRTTGNAERTGTESCDSRGLDLKMAVLLEFLRCGPLSAKYKRLR